MRLFHLADLHIGKRLNNHSFIEDQRYILEKVKEAIIEQKPHAILLAGDIYDKRMPPIEAVELLDQFLAEVILELKTPVIAIAGNHDSGERLDFASSLLNRAGLHIEGKLRLPIPKVQLEDESGTVNFYLMPYGDLPHLKYLLGEQGEGLDYEEAMDCILQGLVEQMKDGERHVLLGHGYVTKGESLAESELQLCDSEKPLSIGGTEYWTTKQLEPFQYVALGHLHGSQRTGMDKVRYAGSPLKYSFSEENQKKSITQIDLDSNGNIDLSFIPLVPLREMRTIRGNMQELINPEVYRLADTDDYIRAIVTDKDEVVEPMATLRAVYPNILFLENERNHHLVRLDEITNVQQRQKNKLELFEEFYQHITQESLEGSELEVMKQLIETVEKQQD